MTAAGPIIVIAAAEWSRAAVAYEKHARDLYTDEGRLIFIWDHMDVIGSNPEMTLVRSGSGTEVFLVGELTPQLHKFRDWAAGMGFPTHHFEEV